MEDMGNVLTETEISGLFQGVTEVEKASAYKIDVSFERRFRVWQQQILPDRMGEIHQEGTVEFVERMIKLLIADGTRLAKRAIREEKTTGKVEMNARIEVVDTIVKDTLDIYKAQITALKLLETGVE